MKIKASATSAALVVVSFLLFKHCSLDAQPKQKDYYPMDYTKWMVFIPGNDSIAPFYISAKPVTNKEYILYLVWTTKVFGYYSELVNEAFPFSNSFVRPDDNFLAISDSASFNYYLANSDAYNSDYIFNPEYLNYPVIGITWDQANMYCRWLYDRYNEYCYIKKKFLLFDRDQYNANNFSTESFLCMQYQGFADKVFSFGKIEINKGFDYTHYITRPLFHMPSRYELQVANMSPKTFQLYTVFDEYTTKGSEFLEPFYHYYLPDKNGYIYYFPPDRWEYLFLRSDSAPVTTDIPVKIKEWTLDSYITKEEKNINDIFRDLGYRSSTFSEFAGADDAVGNQKDYMGRMPFIITGENSNSEFEVLKTPEKSVNFSEKENWFLYDDATKIIISSTGDRFTTFRVAVNAIKKATAK